jgi:glycerol-3-phosphate dehydrogenase
MAIHAIDNAANACKLPKHPCVTDTLKIHGYTQHATSDATLNIYGSDAEKIIELSNQQPSLKEKIHAGLPYSKATVVWAVQHEMAMTVEDVLARRTRALFLDATAAVEVAPMVAAMMAQILQKDDHWQQQQVSAFTAIAQNYLAH